MRAILSVCSNSLFITALKLSFNDLIVPPVTAWIAKLKYGIAPGSNFVSSPHCIDFLRAQSSSALLIKVVAVPVRYCFCTRGWLDVLDMLLVEQMHVVALAPIACVFVSQPVHV